MGFDPVSYIIGRRVGQAAADPLKSWSELQLWLRAGQLGQVLEAGDQLNVEVSGTVRDFDVLGLDEDVPVGAGLSHVLSIQSHGILSSILFDPPMYLFAVTAEACTAFGWPSTGANAGMPAGTYNVTLLRGAYDGSTDQDGTYQFTTTQIVPIGGGVRHSQIGIRNDAGYTKANLLAGTFTTYAADTITTVETGLATTEGNGGTNLGTTTAYDPQYKSGDYINFAHRQAHGCNRLFWSYLWQYLNSDDAAFVWERKSIWSRDLGIAAEGFLHAIDPALRQVIGKVRRRVALSVSDGGGYEDLEGFCFPSFIGDVLGYATQGEGPVDASGTLTRSGAYSLWSGATESDRVKYLADVASAWWMGSTQTTGSACAQRYFSNTGTVRSGTADIERGIVPNLYIT